MSASHIFIKPEVNSMTDINKPLTTLKNVVHPMTLIRREF